MQTCANTERQLLCDLVAHVGPKSPTLCDGWSVDDLVTHLCIRESLGPGFAGLFIPALAPFTRRATARICKVDFNERVERIRRGGVMPLRGSIAEAFGLLEFVVHRQDVIRAIDPGSGADVDRAEVRAAVFRQLRGARQILGRRMPQGAGVLLRDPKHGSVDIRRGHAVVTVVGPAVELAMWAFGRTDFAKVAVHSPASHPDLGALIARTTSV